jgi:hypothetical protein
MPQRSLEFEATTPDETRRRPDDEDGFGSGDLPRDLVRGGSANGDASAFDQLFGMLTGRRQSSGDKFGIESAATDRNDPPRGCEGELPSRSDARWFARQN